MNSLRDNRRAADKRNLAAVIEILPELLRTHAGSFVLVRDGQIVQYFSAGLEAIACGQESFEDRMFSVIELHKRLANLAPPEAAAAEPAQPVAREAPAALQPAPAQPVVREAPTALQPEPVQPVASEAPTVQQPTPAPPVAREAPAAPQPAPASDHPMRVIVFASQKGGAGKTTLCGHVAVQAERAGAGPVALIDTDPQGSLAEWWNAREAETPLFVKTQFANLTDDLNQLRAQGIDLVFVDTPPAVTDTIREVVGYGDLVIIPTRPSLHDLRTVGATVDIIEDQDRPLIFVINAAIARARINSDAALALSQHGTIAPVTVHHRLDFVTSMMDGRTVIETDPESHSAGEIAGLWDYILKRLSKVAPR